MTNSVCTQEYMYFDFSPNGNTKVTNLQTEVFAKSVYEVKTKVTLADLQRPFKLKEDSVILFANVLTCSTCR